LSGASASLARKIAAAEKRGRAKIPGGRPLSNPLPFCPPERIFFRNQRPDFRGKRFGFHSGDTAHKKLICQRRKNKFTRQHYQGDY